MTAMIFAKKRLRRTGGRSPRFIRWRRTRKIGRVAIWSSFRHDVLSCQESKEREEVD
jgi:hypothetical protein